MAPDEDTEHYRSKVHELTERVARMTSAASSAAASAVKAIEEIQALQLVVEAAVRWREAAEAPISLRVPAVIVAEKKLREAIDAHLERVRGRS